MKKNILKDSTKSRSIKKFDRNIKKVLELEKSNVNLLSLKNFKKNTLKSANKEINSTLDSIESQIIAHYNDGGDKYSLLKVLAKYKYNAGMYIDEKSELIRIGVHKLINLLKLLAIVIAIIILRASNLNIEIDNVYSIISKIANSIFDFNIILIIIGIVMVLLYIILCIDLMIPGKQEEVMRNSIIFIEEMIELEYAED